MIAITNLPYIQVSHFFVQMPVIAYVIIDVVVIITAFHGCNKYEYEYSESKCWYACGYT